MKLNTQALIKIIKEVIIEISRQPGNAPPGTFAKEKKPSISTLDTGEGTFVDDEKQKKQVKSSIANLLGGDEEMAGAIMAAVRLALRGEK